MQFRSIRCCLPHTPTHLSFHSGFLIIRFSAGRTHTCGIVLLPQTKVSAMHAHFTAESDAFSQLKCSETGQYTHHKPQITSQILQSLVHSFDCRRPSLSLVTRHRQHRVHQRHVLRRHHVRPGKTHHSSWGRVLERR